MKLYAAPVCLCLQGDARISLTQNSVLGSPTLQSPAIRSKCPRSHRGDSEPAFAPHTLATTLPSLLLVRPPRAPKSVKALMEYASAKPGSLQRAWAAFKLHSHLSWISLWEKQNTVEVTACQEWYKVIKETSIILFLDYLLWQMLTPMVRVISKFLKSPNNHISEFGSESSSLTWVIQWLQPQVETWLLSHNKHWARIIWLKSLPDSWSWETMWKDRYLLF